VLLCFQEGSVDEVSFVAAELYASSLTLHPFEDCALLVPDMLAEGLGG
jgi:hypothetical protein